MEGIKEIATGKLAVDTGNFRIGDQDGVREAYLAMLDEQKDNLANLADDIVTLGLSPADPFIVCPDLDNAKSFVVCEGNRRLTCIRLLETPALAADTPYHKKFLALSQKYKLSPIRKINCVLMPDKETAFQWIERKHLSLDGRGVAQWNSVATGRAKAFRGKVRPSLAVVDYLKSKNMMPAQLSNALKRRTTNLDRVFQMPYMKDALGVEIDAGEIRFANGDVKKGARLLHKMVAALAEKDFTVNKIRHDSDRKDFIDTFAADAVLKAGSEGEADGKGKFAGAKKSDPKGQRSGKSAPSPLERKTLAMPGREFALHILEPRLNALYLESKELNPERMPNAGAIMTRVFLELSTDYFLTKKKAPIPEKHQGKKHWSDIGINLRDKMEAALRMIDPSYKDPAFKEVRRGISGGDALHSIDALHEVMHQLTADRDPKEVKRIWTRWQPYMAALFDSLSEE